MTDNKQTNLTYRDSGVDIDAGNYSVKLIKDSVKATYRPEVLGDLGGFGGLFALNSGKYKEPVLVSGTDGVGTKLRLAFMLDKHDTIGQDAVAMCVNDILVQGAEPLYFLDYLAVGKLDPEKVATVVKGVAGACKESGCALIGGETAEMAGFYADGEYDIAGFAVGVVDKANIITGKKIKSGDVLLGIPSSGVHSNGYSLVRKICFDVKGFKGEEKFPELNGKTLGEELLTPTRLYPSVCLPLIEKYDIHGTSTDNLRKKVLARDLPWDDENYPEDELTKTQYDSMKATIENSYTPYNEATKDYEDSQTRREWNPSSKKWDRYRDKSY